MNKSRFFKLFPPPKFLLMNYAGLDVSDDDLTYIEYAYHGNRRVLGKYGRVSLPEGVMEAGEIKDEERFTDILTKFVKDQKISYAKISLPEEKAYLFETDVPYGDWKTIHSNIEFKLDQNVPLSAADSYFNFDLLPIQVNSSWRASVSAVPLTYISRMITIFKTAGIIPVSFETTPGALTRIVSDHGSGAAVILHTMKTKTGIYVSFGDAVGFTSTVAFGSNTDPETYNKNIATEIRRVYTYWLAKAQTAPPLSKIIVCGINAEATAASLRTSLSDILPVEVGNIWRDIFDLNHYAPAISKSDSFEYAVAAGLAL